jgi:hypothetical protein
VEQQSDDIAGVSIGDNFVDELRQSRVAQESLLNRLLTKLRELREEKLFRSWKCALNELKLSKLFEVVEV